MTQRDSEKYTDSPPPVFRWAQPAPGLNRDGSPWMGHFTDVSFQASDWTGNRPPNQWRPCVIKRENAPGDTLQGWHPNNFFKCGWI